MHAFRPMLPLFLATTFLLALQLQSVAKIIKAASVSYSDVDNAVATASPGDTVMIPAGTATWTQQVYSHGVSLIGAGSNATIIIDEIPRPNGTGTPILNISTTNQLTEVSQLQLAGGTTNTQYNYNGEIAISGDSPKSWRIDHVFFNGLYGKNIVAYGNPYAVVDHCLFTMRAVSVTVYSDGYGDTNWATPPDYGGTDMVYVESCLFTNIVGYPAAVMDGDAGARVVFRYNVVLNDFWANHGTESGQRYRSMRSFEIYNNSFTDVNNFTWAIQSRGGTGVVYSNTAVGYHNLCGMFYYRVGEAFNPWGGANGANLWDTNTGNLYLTGTHSGPSGSTVLIVNNAAWTVNQWVGYSVTDTNSGKFSIITSNNANTITVYPSKDFGSMTFNTGDYFKIYRLEGGLDQPGRGSGDLIQGDGYPYGPIANVGIGGTNWPRQVSEPVYFWGNTLNGVASGGESDYPNIRSGRDFINNTTKPNYTPLTYPHPLTFVTSTNVSGGGGGITNTGTTNPGTTNPGTTNIAGGTNTAGTNTAGTNKLSPPSNLHIIP